MTNKGFARTSFNPGGTATDNLIKPSEAGLNKAEYGLIKNESGASDNLIKISTPAPAPQPSIDEIKQEALAQLDGIIEKLGIKTEPDEYGLQMACFNLPDSKLEVQMREPRAGDIRHMEMENRQLENKQGMNLEGTLTSTYPLLTRIICKWGNNLQTRNPNNGLTLKACVTYDNLDMLTLQDLTALSAVCNFFRGEGS